MASEDFAALARSVERGQAAAMVELSVEAQPLEDGWMTFGGPGAFVNKACGLGLAGPVAKEAGRDLVDFFASRGVEPRVELCPYVHPSLLVALGRAGFQLHEFENVFFRPLGETENFRAALPSGWPQGLTVDRVDAKDALAIEEYVRLSSQGFFPDGKTMSKGFLESAMKAPLLPHTDSFVARLEGQAVGAGGCSMRAGLLSLFGTSVRPEFRKRGVQQALVAARLERGRERGAGLATIVSLAGAGTERNAVRLGFRMAYTRAALVRPGEGLVPSP
jgi:ribosomal protein S18 acetylase RimI-like enzyme